MARKRASKAKPFRREQAVAVARAALRPAATATATATASTSTSVSADDATLAGAATLALAANDVAPYAAPGASLPAANDAWLGRVLGGRYRLLARLATGGMGQIYAAQQLTLGRTVAVKVVRASWHARRPDAARRRFFAEASAAAQLHHPHSVSIFDFGSEPDGTCYLVMELLPGKSLGTVLREEGPLPIPRALSIALQTGWAMQAAHAQGLVHRDLKPDNLMLLPGQAAAGLPWAPAADFVKVVDYGLVKQFVVTSERTDTGQFLGSPNYMAPEQVLGQALDGRCDVYGLGAVLFEMLAGVAPYAAASPHETMRAHLAAPLPSVWQLRSQSAAQRSQPQVLAASPKALQPPELAKSADSPDSPDAHPPCDAATMAAIDQLLGRALAKAPEARFATMAQLVAALAQILRRSPLPELAPPTEVAVRSGHTTLALLPAARDASAQPPLPTAPPAAAPTLLFTAPQQLSEASPQILHQAATWTPSYAPSTRGPIAAAPTRVDGVLFAVEPASTITRRRRWPHTLAAFLGAFCVGQMMHPVPWHPSRAALMAEPAQPSDAPSLALDAALPQPPSTTTSEATPTPQTPQTPQTPLVQPTIRLQSTPAGAAVYLAGTQLCRQTPCTARLPDTTKGERITLRFALPGYDDTLIYARIPYGPPPATTMADAAELSWASVQARL